MMTTLIIAAFLTATLSGILGMGGGMLLLATMFCFLPHGQAVPLHAAVQLVSNGSRVVVFWKDVDWAIVARFSVGLIPGVAAAALILWSLGAPGRAEPWLKLAMGVYILIAAFLPKAKNTTIGDGRRGFTLLGLVAGTAAVTVGAVGPLIAPVFAHRGLVKHRLIATKAVCQMATHLLKIPVFWLLGSIEFASFSRLLAAMAVVAVAGTLLGKRLLAHVSPRRFAMLYRIALIIAGVKVLLVDGLARLAGWL
jgi:uncharacterized membrane protein YfcA